MSTYGFRDDKLIVAELEVNKITCADNSYVVSYVIPKLATVATGVILAGWDPNAATTTKLNKDLLIQPPYPVDISVIANVAGSAGGTDSVTIVGLNAQGKAISENILVQATAAGVNLTSNAFAHITSLTPANSDGIVLKTTSIGIQFGNKLGLPDSLAGTADIITFNYNGANATAAHSDVGYSSTYNTVTIPISGSGLSLQMLYRSGLQ